MFFDTSEILVIRTYYERITNVSEAENPGRIRGLFALSASRVVPNIPFFVPRGTFLVHFVDFLFIFSYISKKEITKYGKNTEKKENRGRAGIAA